MMNTLNADLLIRSLVGVDDSQGAAFLFGRDWTIYSYGIVDPLQFLLSKMSFFSQPIEMNYSVHSIPTNQQIIDLLFEGRSSSSQITLQIQMIILMISP